MEASGNEIDIRCKKEEIDDLIKKYGERKFDQYLRARYPIPTPFRRTERVSSKTWPVKNPAAIAKDRRRSESNVPQYVQDGFTTGKMDAKELQEQLRKNATDGKSKPKGKSPGVKPKEKISISEFKIPRGMPGAARPDGTYYPKAKNNNPENDEKSSKTKNKACQTDISAFDDNTKTGSKTLVRCAKIRDPKANFGVDVPREERGRKFQDIVINQSIPLTEKGWVDMAWINKKWKVNNSDEIINDADTTTLSGFLFESYTSSFEEDEEYILPNVTADEANEEITEEEIQDIVIDISEDNSDSINENEEDIIVFHPSSQEYSDFAEWE